MYLLLGVTVREAWKLLFKSSVFTFRWVKLGPRELTRIIWGYRVKKRQTRLEARLFISQVLLPLIMLEAPPSDSFFKCLNCCRVWGRRTRLEEGLEKEVETTYRERKVIFQKELPVKITSIN